MARTLLAVGIPTFREADSIETVVRQVDAGLARLGNPSDCVIVNVDSDSPDQTSEVFLDTPTRCRKESLVITERPRGKGRNVLRFFEYCAGCKVGALATVDGDLRSITPGWVMALLTPVLGGRSDYVTPLYLRHRFDGSATNHFAYPTVRGYFGINLRQPIGGEFAFSPALINYILRQPIEDAVLGYGIDIFLTMHATGGGFKIDQVELGRKLHKPSLPKWHLVCSQAIAAAIRTARLYRFQPGALALESVADFVDDLPQFRARPGVRRFYDELQAMLAEARSKARDLKPLYRSWLGGDREGLFAAFEENGAALSAEAWAELASACLARAVWAEPEACARVFADQLMPVLLIRIITCWNNTWERPIEEFNAEIRNQAELFRDCLLRRWREMKKDR
jgi:hypothetical protein